MSSKYCIMIEPENKALGSRNTLNLSQYSIIDTYKILDNSTDKEIRLLCNKIERHIESILERGIVVSFDILLDSELESTSKKIYNHLGKVEVV